MHVTLSEVRSAFEALGWRDIQGRRGLVVSPDTGRLMRVFCADVKYRFGGTMLLGSIGYRLDNQDADAISLAAYLTNFEAFLDPPVIDGPDALACAVSDIAAAMWSLPSEPAALLDGLSLGQLGHHDANIFLASSAPTDGFIEAIKAMAPCRP